MLARQDWDREETMGGQLLVGQSWLKTFYVQQIVSCCFSTLCQPHSTVHSHYTLSTLYNISETFPILHDDDDDEVCCGFRRLLLVVFLMFLSTSSSYSEERLVVDNSLTLFGQMYLYVFDFMLFPSSLLCVLKSFEQIIFRDTHELGK